MRKVSGTDVPDEVLLLASIADCMRWFKWSFSEDGTKGINYPESFVDQYLGREKKEPEHMVFDSPADFWAKMNEITR